MPIQIPGYQSISAPLDFSLGQELAQNQKTPSPFEAALQRGYELGYKTAAEKDMFQQELAQKQPLLSAQAQQSLAQRDKYLADIDLNRAKTNMDLRKGYIDLQKGSFEVNKAYEEAANSKMAALLPHLVNKTPQELAEISPVVHSAFAKLNPSYTAVVDTNKPLDHDTLTAIKKSLLPIKDQIAVDSPDKLGKLSQLQALQDQNSSNYEKALASGNSKAALLYRQRMEQIDADIRKEITPAEGQHISINTNDTVTNAVKKETGRVFAQELSKEKIAQDRRANNMLSAIQVFRNSMGKSLGTGPYSDKRLQAAKLASSLANIFGIKYKVDEIANSEALVAKAVDMTLSESKKYGPLGGMSDSDRDSFAKLVASNLNSKRGNEIIMNAAESDILAHQDALAFQLAYLERNGTLNGFDAQLRRYKEDLPKTDVNNDFKVIEENLGKYENYLDPKYKGIQYSGVDKDGNPQDISMSEIRKTAKDLNIPAEQVIRDLKLSPKQ